MRSLLSIIAKTASCLLALMTCSLHPNENKNFQLSLLFYQLKKLVHKRTCKFQEYRDPLVTKYLNGLSKAEQVFFEQSFFGCYAGPNKTPAMRRLLESTLELAFPQKGKLLYHNSCGILSFPDCDRLTFAPQRLIRRWPKPKHTARRLNPTLWVSLLTY